MDETPPPQPAKARAEPVSERERKLAAALRANLRRRKAPPGARGDSSPSDPEV